MEDKEIVKQEALPENSDTGFSDQVAPSEETLEKLGRKLAKRFNEFKTSQERSNFERDMASATESYHMMEKTKDSPYPGYPNLSSPLPRIGVDSFHANVMQSLFGNGFRDLVRPRYTTEQFTSSAKRGAKYLSYQLEQEADFYNVMDDADKKAQMFGIAYLEPRYVKTETWETATVTETKNEPVPNPLTGEITLKTKSLTKTEKKKKITFDGIQIESLPVDSIYVSPFVRNIKDAVKNDVLFKFCPTNWEKVLQKSKAEKGKKPFYSKVAIEKIRGFITEKYKERLDPNTLKQAQFDGWLIDSLMAPERIELVEAHLWFDIDGDGTPEKIIATVHVASETVLRVTLGPCRIVELRPRPVNERFHGEGIPKICRPLDIEWEAIHNARVAAGQWENTTFGFYRAGGMFNPSEITVMPGHFYPVADPREVQFAQTPTVRNSYFKEEGLLFDYFQRIFGLTDNIQGVDDPGEQTATENININKNASIKFANPFNRLVMSLEELLGHMWDLNRECAPEEKEYFISGVGATPLFDKIHKKDFAVQLDFKLNISTIFDEQLMRDTWMLVIHTLAPMPIYANNPGVQYNALTNWLKAINVQLDLPIPPEVKVLSPMEEHEIIEVHKPVPDPMPGIDVDDHIKQHMRKLTSDDVKDNWTPAQITELKMLIDKEMILKQTLEQANLNQSGRFEGMPSPMQGGGKPNMPGLTVSRNPSQMMNTVRTGMGGSGQNSADKLASVTNQPKRPM